MPATPNPSGTPSLLWVGDVHVSDTPPGYRTDTYCEDILDKLRFIAQHAATHNVGAVVFAGDLFHRKRGVASALVAGVHDAMAGYTGPKLIIPGNHDMVDNVPESIPGQPIGLLARMPGWHILDYAAGHFQVAPTLIVAGVGYHREPMPRENITFNRPGATAPTGAVRVLGVHYGFVASADVASPYYDSIDVSDPAFDPGCDVLFYGHIHEPSVFSTPGGIPVINPGALSRGSINEAVPTRAPKVVMLTVVNGGPTFTTIPVPHKPAEEAFRLGDHAVEKAAERLSDGFVDAFGGAHVEALTLSEVGGLITSSPASHQAQAIATEAVEAVW